MYICIMKLFKKKNKDTYPPSVCGYLDMQGGFHKSKKDAQNYDIRKYNREISKECDNRLNSLIEPYLERYVRSMDPEKDPDTFLALSHSGENLKKFFESYPDLASQAIRIYLDYRLHVEKEID